MKVERLLSRPPNISSYSKSKELITCNIQRAKTINQLKQIHAHLLITQVGFNRDRLLGHLLSKVFQLQGRRENKKHFLYACNLFDEIPQCNNQFIYTSLIRSHTLHECVRESVLLYARMHQVGVPPSGFTITCVLNACSRLMGIVEGKQVHARLVRSGFCGNNVVNTALLDMYGKSRLVIDARRVFDQMDDGKRDVVAWTAMISGYTKLGMMDDAQKLFDSMDTRQQNIVTWTNMVAGYASLGRMVEAKSLFDNMPFRNSISWLAVIAGYGKCGNVIESKRVFEEINAPDASCWAAMVACFSQNSCCREAIELYEEMRRRNMKSNEVAIVGVISACAQVGDAEMANAVTQHLDEGCCARTQYISNALIHMHAKCGNIDQAWNEFKNMVGKDVVSYTTMILALAEHGMPGEALEIFSSMIKMEGIKPNQITFIGVLCACSQAGLVEEALDYLELMTNSYGIKPLPEHYASIVDLLGRSGQLKRAYAFILKNLSSVDAVVWGSLFAACRGHGDVELGEIVVRHMFKLEPWNMGNYVDLANLYASMGRWGDAERVRKLMRTSRLKKLPGRAWLSE